MIHPRVSVIIPAYNEGAYIGGCLKALKQQEFIPLEVILVDNGSTDRTVQIASELGAKILRNDKVNIAGLRNLGAGVASGEILAFLDSDCLPEPGWIRYAVERLEEEDIGVTGCHCSLPRETTWVERAWYRYKNLQVSPPFTFWAQQICLSVITCSIDSACSVKKYRPERTTNSVVEYEPRDSGLSRTTVFA